MKKYTYLVMEPEALEDFGKRRSPIQHWIHRSVQEIVKGRPRWLDAVAGKELTADNFKDAISEWHMRDRAVLYLAMLGPQRVPHVHWFAVKPGQEAHGYGELVLSELVRFCAGRGWPYLFARTVSWKDTAIQRAYRKFGFRRINRMEYERLMREWFDEYGRYLETSR